MGTWGERSQRCNRLLRSPRRATLVAIISGRRQCLGTTEEAPRDTRKVALAVPPTLQSAVHRKDAPPMNDRGLRQTSRGRYISRLVAVALTLLLVAALAAPALAQVFTGGPNSDFICCNYLLRAEISSGPPAFIMPPPKICRLADALSPHDTVGYVHKPLGPGSESSNPAEQKDGDGCDEQT